MKTVQLLVVEWLPRSFLNPLQSFLILHRDFHAVKRESGKRVRREQRETTIEPSTEGESGIPFPIQILGINYSFKSKNYQKELVLHLECS